MSSNKNEPSITLDNFVNEMLEGYYITYPGSMQVHPCCRKLLVNTSHKNGCVSVFSGGRAGYEPFPAGFVGTGMLSATLYGRFCDSPTTNEIREALQLITAYNIGAGIIVIIPNSNPSNRLNFGSGVKKAKQDGLKVASILVGENYDHPLMDSYKMSMRILCASVFIFKIAGAMSMAGKCIEGIVSTLEKVESSIASFEVHLPPSNLTAPVSTLEGAVKDQEVGELTECHDINTCSSKEAVIQNLRETCNSFAIEPGNEVVILINNLDPTAQMAQWILANEIYKELSKNNVKVLRIYSGNLITCAEKSKLQVCILNLDKNTEAKEEWLHWLDAPTLAPAWPGGSKSIASERFPCYFAEAIIQQNKNLNREVGYKGSRLIQFCIEAATQALIYDEERLNSLDKKCSNGHCGTILKNGAEVIRGKLDQLPLECPAALLSCLANLCESHMVGNLGIIHSLLFTTAIYPLISVENFQNEGEDLPWADAWGKAWRCGINGVFRYYGSKTRNRTMLDLLESACTRYELSSKKNFSEVLLALESCLCSTDDGCRARGKRKTKQSYCAGGHEQLGYDAGMYGVEVWLKAILTKVKHELLRQC